jgi:hypothetical protein
MIWIFLGTFTLICIAIVILLCRDAGKTDRWLEERAEDYDKEMGK